MGTSGPNRTMKEAAEYLLSKSDDFNRTVSSALSCACCRRSTKDWVVLFKCRHIICKICIDLAATNAQTTNDASMEGKAHCPLCNTMYQPKTDMKNKDGMLENYDTLKDYLKALRANFAEQQRIASMEPTYNSQVRYLLDQAPATILQENSDGIRYRVLANPTTEQLGNVSSSSSAMLVYTPRPEHNTHDEITASTEINSSDDEDLTNVTPDKHV